jgi:hypothetical protein
VHFLECDDPTRDEVAKAECSWSTTAAAVELFAVDGFAHVVHGDNAVAIWSCTGAFLNDFVVYAFVDELHTGLLAFFLKPFFVF